MNNEKYTYNEVLEIGEEPEDFYAPDALYDDLGYVMNYDISFPNIPFEEVNNTFHLSRVKHTLKCKKCGSTRFEVGKGLYYTAIKCVNCLYEICIHEG